MKVVKVKPIMSVEDSDKLAGVLLKESHCKQLFREDVDVIDAETGNVLAKFRRNVIPGDIQQKAFKNLLPAAKPSQNRGTATKKVDGNAVMKKPLANGKVSKTTVAAAGSVDSGIAGFFDRTVRFPHCRLTAFTAEHFDKFIAAYPIVKWVDNTYKDLMPKHYKAQRAIADKTSKDFVIPNTSFTTITVNKNWQTAVHKDSGDFKDGFGNLVALRKGSFIGGHFVLPRWGVGFDLQNGDLLLVDVHQWHGNTPIIKENPKAIRLSLVMYYRENMIHCGNATEERVSAKTRKPGDKLYAGK